MNKRDQILTLIVILLMLVVSAIGLFYDTAGESYTIVNRYGQDVVIYGHGLYQSDTAFRAPIHRGTDLVMLFVVTPLFIIAYWQRIARGLYTDQLQFVSLLCIVLYYAASIAFGVSYNSLHLVYIAFFSASLFLMIHSFYALVTAPETQRLTDLKPIKGSISFLIAVGIALTIAWLPDIVSALMAGQPLELIGIYTTEITYVLDMGVISPLALMGVGYILQKKPMGYLIQSLIQVSCVMIGNIVIAQSAFQMIDAIAVPFDQMVSKVLIFIVLAILSFVMEYRLITQINRHLATKNS